MLERKIKLANGLTVQIRAAKESDVPAVTNLIHDSFDVWKSLGLTLSPMFQTEQATFKHLVQKGFVIETFEGDLVATFSLERGQVEKLDDGRIKFTEGDQDIVFDSFDVKIDEGKFLIFRKLAVAKRFGKLGLGTEIVSSVELAARSMGCAGVALETVKEAAWLYDWYAKLGYESVGKHKYEGSQVETLLMLKSGEIHQ